MGDSHAAALKKGWRRIGTCFPDVDITFFASANVDWSSIDLADNRLVPGTARLRENFARSSGGPEEIDASFDAYILCSLGLAISHPLRLWTRHAQPDWSTYQAAVANSVRATHMARVLAMLREITMARAIALASPFQPHAFCVSSPLLDGETALKLGANFIGECRALADEHRAGFITQPAETLAPNGITTQMKFANPSTNPEHEDRRHCNPDYGVLAMRKVLESGLGLAPVIAD